MVVDYLQIVEPENRKDPRHEQVAGIGRLLKNLAWDLRIPIIAMAQLNRGPEILKDPWPRLSDLRESRIIAHDADTVFLLHNRNEKEDDEADESEAQEIEVHIAKQRNGPTGRVILIFRKRFMRFEDYGPEVNRELC